MCIERSGDGQMGTASPAQKLSELREIALLLAADVVDRQLEAYLHRNGIPQTFGAQERILVCITPRANAGAHDRERQAQRGPVSRRSDRGLRAASGNLRSTIRRPSIAIWISRAPLTPASKFWTARTPSRRY